MHKKTFTPVLNAVIFGEARKVDAGREFHSRLVLGIYELRCSSVFDLGIRAQYGCPLTENLVAFMLGAREGRISASSMDGWEKM